MRTTFSEPGVPTVICPDRLSVVRPRVPDTGTEPGSDGEIQPVAPAILLLAALAALAGSLRRLVRAG